MKHYCTTCCPEKSKEGSPIASIDRYLSPRIQAVYQKSKKEDVSMLIFSGKYGFIKPETKIPWYDKILKEEEVDKNTSKWTKQLLRYRVSALTCFLKPRSEEGWNAYHQAIKAACRDAKIKLLVEVI